MQSSDTNFKKHRVQYVHIFHLTVYLLWNAIVTLNFRKLITKFIRRIGDLKQRRLESLHCYTYFTKPAFMHWNAKFAICGISSFWSVANLSQKLYERLVISNNVSCSIHVCIFYQSSIPVLKCEVRNLWYLVAFKLTEIYHKKEVSGVRRKIPREGPKHRGAKGAIPPKKF